MVPTLVPTASTAQSAMAYSPAQDWNARDEQVPCPQLVAITTGRVMWDLHIIKSAPTKTLHRPPATKPPRVSKTEQQTRMLTGLSEFCLSNQAVGSRMHCRRPPARQRAYGDRQIEETLPDPRPAWANVSSTYPPHLKTHCPRYRSRGRLQAQEQMVSKWNYQVLRILEVGRLQSRKPKIKLRRIVCALRTLTTHETGLPLDRHCRVESEANGGRARLENSHSGREGGQGYRMPYGEWNQRSPAPLSQMSHKILRNETAGAAECSSDIYR